jgi:hypothetical protein
VHALDGLFELFCFNFGQARRISWGNGGGHRIGGLADAAVA